MSSNLFQLRQRVAASGHSLPFMVVIVLAALPYECSTIQATPVTFRFEATISEVQGDVAALNLPFGLTVGQEISGDYTFESDEVLLDIFLHHELGRQGLITLTIGGSEVVARTNFGTLNDGGPIDINDPLPLPNSSLSLGYLSPTDVIPGWGGLAGISHAWGATWC